MVDPDVVRHLLTRSRSEGYTNPAVANRLFVSEAAVRKYVGNIFAKLPLESTSDRRVTAVLTYLRQPT